MPCLVSVYGTFRETTDQYDKYPKELGRSAANIFSSSSNCEKQWSSMVIGWKIGQVSLVRCKNNWHNQHSSRKCMLCMPPLVQVHLTSNSATIQASTHIDWKSRCTWNVRCARTHHLHWKIFPWYSVPKICEWSSIKLSLRSRKSASERSCCRASAHWIDSILKFSSPRFRCWSL